MLKQIKPRTKTTMKIAIRVALDIFDDTIEMKTSQEVMGVMVMHM